MSFLTDYKWALVGGALLAGTAAMPAAAKAGGYCRDYGYGGGYYYRSAPVVYYEQPAYYVSRPVYYSRSYYHPPRHRSFGVSVGYSRGYRHYGHHGHGYRHYRRSYR